MELDATAPLNAFFGALPAHPVGTPYTAPAVRAILFTDVCGSVAQTQLLGDDGHMELLREHNDIVRSELSARSGREVKHTGDGIMATFTSIVEAVEFAVSVQRRMHARNQIAATPFTSASVSARVSRSPMNTTICSAPQCNSPPDSPRRRSQARSRCQWAFENSVSANRSASTIAACSTSKA